MESKRKSFRVACVQIKAGESWEKNLPRALQLAEEALQKKASLIAYPENFLCRGELAHLKTFAQKAYGRIVSLFCDFARTHGVALLLGSLPEPSRHTKKLYNTSVLVGPHGKVIAAYRKRNLFEIQYQGLSVKESDWFKPGDRAAVAPLSEELIAGLSICYDVRFPELYRELVRRGAQVLFVPANFTYLTGRAHWEVLLRARAIENQAYVIAPGQAGVSPCSGIKSFGTSLIIDPWGKILAKGSIGSEEVICADLHYHAVVKLRSQFPVLPKPL